MTSVSRVLAVGLALAGLVSATAGAQTAQIAEGIYAYTPGNGYYSMFVVTDDGVIAIESVNDQHAQGLLQAIRETTDQPIRYLIHSHNHWDHAGGGQVFKSVGATTLIHAEAYEWLAVNPGPVALPDESWSGTRKDITLGGTTLELHYMGMNHGLGTTIFLLPEQRVLYVADLVAPNRVLFTIVPDFNIKEWERTLADILELDFERAVFSHNERPDALNAAGTRQDVADELQFIRDLRAAIHAEFAKGTNPFLVPGIVELPQYAHWVGYDQWLEMNAWRVMLDDWMGPFPWRAEGGVAAGKE